MNDIILKLLDLITYRNKNGLTISDQLKEFSYNTLEERNRCICGGTIIQRGIGQEGWEISCNQCGYLYNED